MATPKAVWATWTTAQLDPGACGDRRARVLALLANYWRGLNPRNRARIWESLSLYMQVYAKELTVTMDDNLIITGGRAPEEIIRLVDDWVDMGNLRSTMEASVS